jgi:hypothetical protein
MASILELTDRKFLLLQSRREDTIGKGFHSKLAKININYTVL